MRIFILIVFVLLNLCPIYANPSPDTFTSHWYTTPDNRYTIGTPPSEQEAAEIVSNPIYTELSEYKDYYRIRRLEIITGIAMTQLKQNTSDSIMVGKSNLMPTFIVEGNFWITRWLGVGANWTNVVFITLGSERDPNVPNPVYIRPSWLDIYAKFRYMFDNKDGSSFVALKIGRHSHDFPVLTYPQYIFKSHAQGIDIGAEHRLAFSNMFGLNMNLDFLWLTKLEDVSTVSNSQKGIGYKFGIDFYGTVMDRKGLKTMISIGYGQTSYISNLYGSGVSGDSRPALGVNHFEQTYSNIHLTFTARI
ncbi:MAG: hypothetical protein NTY22_04250 [Proteobacteria bacterium]|nr:hypothetical protein [Pseudomonadota bacterium]